MILDLLVNFGEYYAYIKDYYNGYASSKPLQTDQSNQKPNLTFLDSVFYAGTLYTSIGYGNRTPQTKVGRIFTMIYSAIGIPLALFTLAQLGKMLCSFMLHCYATVRKCGVRKNRYTAPEAR